MFPAPLDPIATLLGLANEVNPELPAALSAGNVVLGHPTPMARPILGGINTQIPVTAITGRGYTLDDTLYYRRVDVATIFAAAGISPQININNAASWSAILDQLNTRYGASFGTADLPTGPVVVHDAQVVVVMPPSSLLYTGQLTVALVGGLSLSTAVPLRRLQGLTPPVLPGVPLGQAIANPRMDGLTLPI